MHFSGGRREELQRVHTSRTEYRSLDTRRACNCDRRHRVAAPATTFKQRVKQPAEFTDTTHKSKLSACAKVKNLIETNRMTVYSSALISELKTFVASGLSFAAKIGETDDLVMSMLLAVRMMQVLQSFYTELDSQMKDHSDNVIEPMPFISTMY